MSLSSCCVEGFQWDGAPSGRVGKLGANDAYIAGDNPSAALLLVHDIFGWEFPNVRLLADHYAREAGLTVYVPDFFAGENLPADLIVAGRFDLLDLPAFIGRHSRRAREPEVFACARALRGELGFERVGALGFCYGGWAVLRLGAKEHSPPLVECVATAHPSMLVEADIDGLAVPAQFLAPEHDEQYTVELKRHTFETLMRNGVPFDYHHFPGVKHGCLARADEGNAAEREALVRGKNAVVTFMKQYLHPS